MTGKLARPLAFALLLTGLALPAAAWPARSTPEPDPSFLFQIWERLSAPLLALFEADETDGRSIWDPDGVTVGDPAGTENDGRSIWDPNG